MWLIILIVLSLVVAFVPMERTLKQAEIDRRNAGLP